jgi:hypothetical protein
MKWLQENFSQSSEKKSMDISRSCKLLEAVNNISSGDLVPTVYEKYPYIYI